MNIKMNLVHHCDACSYQLEEMDKEVPIEVLKMPSGELYYFCSEKCLDDFLRDCILEGYVYPNGSVDIDD